MKYDKDHIDKIKEALENGKGRVQAAGLAGISYETFTVWMETKSEFSEMVKRAEGIGKDGNKYYAISCIFAKMKDQWQAAAWWLERNYPNEFGKEYQEPKDKEQIIINYKVNE